MMSKEEKKQQKPIFNSTVTIADIPSIAEIA